MTPAPGRIATFASVLLVITTAACRGGPVDSASRSIVPGGDAERGARVIRSFDCGTCHVIPGIRGADGLVGPPLTRLARRTYIAGRVLNQPEALVQWVMAPRSVDELTVMPAVGLNEQEARDVAAYLYTLR